MPDNKPKDWNADEQFWAEAWKDMEGQLDQAMPLTKDRRRRWLPFWLFGTMIPLVAVILLAIYTPDEGTKIPAQEEQSELPLPTLAPGHPQVGNDLPLKNAQPVDVPSEQSIVQQSDNEQIDLPNSKLIGKTGLTIETSKAEEPTTITIGEVALDKPGSGVANSPQETQGQTPFGAEKTSEDLEKEETTASSFVAERAAPIAALVKTENRLQVTSRQVANTFQFLKPDTLSKAVSASPSKYRALVYASGNIGSQWPGLGLSGGIGVEREIGRKGRLSATIGYQVQDETLGSANESNVSLSDVSTPFPNGERFILDALDNTSNSNGDRFIRTEYLRLGLNYTRNFGKRFHLGIGAGINYVNRVRISTNFEDDLSIATNLTGNFYDLSNTNVAQLQNSSSIDLDEFIGLRRLRSDLRVSAGYRLGKYFSVESSVIKYLSPVLNPDQYSSDSWRGDLRLIFKF